MAEIPISSLALDPVCNMNIPICEASGSFVFDGTEFYFCSSQCLEEFKAQPRKFLSRQAVTNEHTKPSEGQAYKGATGQILTNKSYSCPMHPQVQLDKSGSCPICGMALEARFDDLSETDRYDLEQFQTLDFFRRRFLVCFFLCAPVLWLSMSEMPVMPFPDNNFWHLHANQSMSELTQFVLTTAVVFWGGATFLRRAFDSLRNRQTNMYTLIALGVLAAYLFSSFVVFAHLLLTADAFKATLGQLVYRRGVVTLYFESAAAIITISLLGQYLELKARYASGSAVRSLMALAPKIVTRVNHDGSEEKIAIKNVQVGDILRIRAGERIPTDGTLLAGFAIIDESMLTGEAMPQEKGPGAFLSAGTTNGTSTLTMRCHKKAEDSYLATIIRVVQDSQRAKIKAQDLADRISSKFVPSVALIAIITFLVWAIVAKDVSLGFTNAIAVLIIACPCALGLATPVSVLVASGVAASYGILMRKPQAMQRLEQVTILAVDKTGTLTEGKPTLTQILVMPDWTENQVLRLAASLEAGSDHPFARTVFEAAAQTKIKVPAVSNFEYLIGQGLKGVINEQQVCLGSPAFFRNQGIDLTNLLSQLKESGLEDLSIVALAVAQKPAGLLVFKDQLKPSSYLAIQQLTKRGIKVAVVSGDCLSRVASVASSLQLQDFYAELSPSDKAQVISKFHDHGEIVAMAGDGINDAPALSLADVSMAMADSSGVALDTADLVLVRGDLLALTRAFRLAKAMMSNIRQNLCLAFIYNALAIPIAAGVLIPICKIALDPALASLAMGLSSLSVVGNSLRLRNLRL